MKFTTSIRIQLGLLGHSILFAQAPTSLGYGTFKPERGFFPTGAYSVSDTESISDTTGNVNLRMPLGSLPVGRAGQSFQLSLTYNSRPFNLRSTNENTNTVIDNYPGPPGTVVTVNRLVPEGDGGGWKYNFSSYLEYETRPVSCSSQPYANALRFIGPDGDSHALRLTSTYSFWNDTDGNSTYSQYSPTGQLTCFSNASPQLPANIGPVVNYYTTDGSYLRVQVRSNDGIWRAVYPDGRYVQGPIIGGATKWADRFCDRNANCIAVTNTAPSASNPNAVPTTEIEDEWHRKLTVTYTSSSSSFSCPNIPCATSEVDEVRSLGYPAVAADATDPRLTTSNLTKVTWKNVLYGLKANTQPILYACRVPDASTEYNCKHFGSLRVVDTITLPNAALQYKFDYADDDAPQRGWGQLRRMTLPSNDATKATVDYSYTRLAPTAPVNSPNTPVPWDDVLEDPITQKTLTYYDQTDTGLATTATVLNWTYQITRSTGTVTNPDGGVTTSLFYSRTTLPSSWKAGLVYQVTDPANGQIQRVWAQNEPWIGNPAAYDPKNPYVRAEYRKLPENSTRIAATATELDKNGNVTLRSDYDWVPYSTISALPYTLTQPPMPIAPLRNTQNLYAATTPNASNTPVQGESNAYWTPTSPQTRFAVKETRVFGGDSSVVGNTKKLSQFIYDDPLLTANPLQEWHWRGGTIPPFATALSTSNAILTTRTWDAGNLLTETDPNSVLTSYEYAVLPNCPTTYSRLYPSKVTAAGAQRTFEYHCATGLLTKEIAVSNHNLETTMDYDIYGRMITQTRAANVSTHSQQRTMAYDDLNRLVRTASTIAPATEVVTVQHFDQLGRLFLQRATDEVKGTPAFNSADTGGVKTLSLQRTVVGESRYELESNSYREPLATESSPTMGWSWKRYDRAGRLLETRQYAGAGKPAPWNVGTPPSQVSRALYYYTGDTTEVVDAGARNRMTVIDSLGRVKSATDGFLVSANYQYNVLDSLTQVTQTDSTNFGGPVTQTRNFDYDGLQRLQSTTQPESGLISYEYFDNGTLKKKTDARGVTTTYTLDARNRVKTKGYSDVSHPTFGTLKTPFVTYCYDGQSFDPAANAGSGGCTAARTTDWPYGALTGYGSTRNGALVTAVNHTYLDPLGRVTASAHYLPGLNATSGTTAPAQFAYEYNLGGLQTKITYPSGRVVEYTPTVANRVATVKRSSTQNYLSGAQYTADGALAAAAFGASAYSQSWSYNAMGQLKSTAATKGANLLLGLTNVYTAAYDAATLAESGSDNNGNLRYQRIQYPTATVLQSFGYDNASRLTSFSEAGKSQNFAYDGFGNIRQMAQSNISPQQQLVQVSPDWYAPLTNQLKATAMAYDAAGQQLHELNDTNRKMGWNAEGQLVAVSASGAKSAESYEYDGDGLRLSRTVGAATTYFVYDAGGQLMAEYPANAAFALGATVTSYLVGDHLQSTRLVVDESGACVERMDYLPFGADNLRAAGDCYGSASGVRQRFTGQLRDTETGLDFFEARYLSAVQGRMTSPDEPLTYSDVGNPQSWNGYSYAFNNPLLYSDPTGHFGESTGPAPPGLNPLQELEYRTFLFTLQLAQQGRQLSAPMVNAIQNFRNNPNCAAGLTIGGAAIGAGVVGTIGGAGGGAGGFLAGAIVPGAGNAAGLIGGGTLGYTGGALVGGSIGGTVGGALSTIACSVGSSGAGGGKTGSRENREYRPKTKGANANDGKEIRGAARGAGIDSRKFGKFVEAEKLAEGRAPSENYTFEELKKLAELFKKEGR